MSIPTIGGQPAGAVTTGSGTPSQQTKGTTQSGAAAQSTNSASSTQSSKPPASYSVSISSAARAALAEATETSVQTAKEARGGDIQAQRLLAKENAQKVA